MTRHPVAKVLYKHLSHIVPEAVIATTTGKKPRHVKVTLASRVDTHDVTWGGGTINRYYLAYVRYNEQIGLAWELDRINAVEGGELHLFHTVWQVVVEHSTFCGKDAGWRVCLPALPEGVHEVCMDAMMSGGATRLAEILARENMPSALIPLYQMYYDVLVVDAAKAEKQAVAS